MSVYECITSAGYECITRSVPRRARRARERAAAGRPRPCGRGRRAGARARAWRGGVRRLLCTAEAELHFPVMIVMEKPVLCPAFSRVG